MLSVQCGNLAILLGSRGILDAMEPSYVRMLSVRLLVFCAVGCSLLVEQG